MYELKIIEEKDGLMRVCMLMNKKNEIKNHPFQLSRDVGETKTKFTGPGSLRDVVELYSPNAVWSLTHFLKSQRPSVITAESFIETFELSCRKKSHDSCGCSSSFWSPGTSQSQR
jgi:hypothetical protein